MFLIIASTTSLVSDLIRISFIKLEAFLFLVRNFINKVASPLLYIFGSRARGDAKKYSDIDIAIKSKDLTPQITEKLKYIFENSTLPYEVDIVDLNNISENFKNIILGDLKKV